MVPIVGRLDSGSPVMNAPVFGGCGTGTITHAVPEKFL